MWTRSLLLALLFLGVIAARASEVLERTVATVNGHVILSSEWDDEVRFECLMSSRRPSDMNPAEEKAALDRLIDQELLREQMRLTEEKPVETPQVEKQVESLKGDYLRDHAGESWEGALSKYHLSEKVVVGRVTAELQQLQFIDERFRPSVQVSAGEIETYYKEQLVPKLPAADPVTLAEATPKIREILAQNKINQMLSSWLDTLRAQAQIRIVAPNRESGTPQNQAP